MQWNLALTILWEIQIKTMIYSIKSVKLAIISLPNSHI